MTDANQVASWRFVRPSLVSRRSILWRDVADFVDELFGFALAGLYTRGFGGCARKYESDSSDVVRSTVFTLTPSRAFNGAGAKFRTAFTPAAMI